MEHCAVRLRVGRGEDLWAGLLFIAIGLAALVVAREYPMGTAMRMGPGYFPTYVGAITALLGGIIVIRSLQVEGRPVAPFPWRGVLLLALAFAAFGWGIERLGLVISLAALVGLSALAAREFRLKDVVLLALVLIALSCALFVYALGLPLRLWW